MTADDRRKTTTTEPDAESEVGQPADKPVRRYVDLEAEGAADEGGEAAAHEAEAPEPELLDEPLSAGDASGKPTRVYLEEDVSATRAYIGDNSSPEPEQEPAGGDPGCRYTIQERIARGAESVLYLAADSDGEQYYCVKAIRNLFGRLLGSSRTKRDEAKLEVRYAAKVKHIKNEFEVGQKLQRDGDMPIVRMYALRRIKPCFIELGYDLLMEYIDGNDLGDRRAVTMLSVEDKVNLFFQTAMALRYMHLAGYVHLDMKPSNVMVTKGKVRLIDFGMTAPIGTKLRTISGTAGYLSPEQLVRKYVDEATDIFALGVTFAAVFGGKPLRQNHDDLLEKSLKMEAKFHLEKSEQPMVDEVPEVQHIPKLVELIRRCTIPKRERRIRSTNTIINSLHRIAREIDIKLTEPC